MQIIKFLLHNLSLLTASLVWVITLAACNKGNDDEKKKEDEQLAQAEMAALKVAVIPTADAMPIFVAKERGFFEKYDVDVRLKCKQSQMDCDQAMISGEVEMMMSDLMRTERLITEGMPLKYVTATNAYWQLIGNRVSRVRKVDQLGDKMMAIARFSATDYLGTLAVDSAKPKLPVFRIQINDVDVRLKMLTNNEIDAVWLTEPQATAARIQHHLVLFDSKNHDISLGVIAMKAKALNDERVKKQFDAFVRAYNVACDSLNAKGLQHYADIMEKYCHVENEVVAQVPNLTFRHTNQPRQKDIERTKNVKWKTF